MRKLSRRISVIAGAAFLAATGGIAAGIGGGSAVMARRLREVACAGDGGRREAR